MQNSNNEGHNVQTLVENTNASNISNMMVSKFMVKGEQVINLELVNPATVVQLIK